MKTVRVLVEIGKDGTYGAYSRMITVCRMAL
jgi:hypothetical protein